MSTLPLPPTNPVIAKEHLAHGTPHLRHKCLELGGVPRRVELRVGHLEHRLEHVRDHVRLRRKFDAEKREEHLGVRRVAFILQAECGACQAGSAITVLGLLGMCRGDGAAPAKWTVFRQRVATLIQKTTC